jgi:hypothetical protein
VHVGALLVPHAKSAKLVEPGGSERSHAPLLVASPIILVVPA